MNKVKSSKLAVRLEDIPNVGSRIADDFRSLGLRKPKDLKSKDPYKLYLKLCKVTKSYQDPCVLDTFMAAVSFMNGGGPRPWWAFTKDRKKKFQKVGNKLVRK